MGQMCRVVPGVSQDIRPGLREAVLSAMTTPLLRFAVTTSDTEILLYCTHYKYLLLQYTVAYRYTVVHYTVQPVLHEVAVLLQVSLFRCNRR